MSIRPDGQEYDGVEMRDWLESLRDELQIHGPRHVRSILRELQISAQMQGVQLPVTSQTPYVNTIPVDLQPPYPGDREIERRIKSIIRWNAMAMVVRANLKSPGVGGHISTYASAASLYEVGFHHFFRGRSHPSGGDHVYFQGHAAPGIYARAFLEGRLTERQLENFRREMSAGGGLSSYPHPWLMRDFWEFPTVSMGLSPIMAIYQARFIRYLQDRGLRPPTDAHVWCFMGDGECDEPESLGAISLASRERLDNLIFVINCNLQRLDGPVRGNGKIIQELEAVFRGDGWNVLKVIWGGDWDPLFERDYEGRLVKRLGEMVDGEYQRLRVKGGAYIRQNTFGVDPVLAEMAKDYTDDQLWKLRLGGHDPEKVYAAFQAAAAHKGSPTVILAHTIKGYGLGEAGEGRNITHQQKKLNEQELREFRDRFAIPIPDDQVGDAPFFKPPPNSPEIRYLQERRAALGGPVPARRCVPISLKFPGEELYDEFLKGSGDRDMATTMAFVRLLTKLMRDPRVGSRIVPIIPDEARTFGMEGMFRQFGIYSSVGQLYEPVDLESVLYYKEAKDGQILEEGITEAGCMSSFIAAGTAHATHGLGMIPVFLFYSMFGFQRIGDLAWAAGDSRTRGFLIGGTAGRTTLSGEGLQHEDGHSHVIASTVPNLMAYDPGYAYEVAVIVQEGLRRMYELEEDVFYYITVYNEAYSQPKMPRGVRDEILKGMYQLQGTDLKKPKGHAQLLGSGSILNEAVAAKQILEEKYGVAAEVWSVTSYKELRRDALRVQRENLLNPRKKEMRAYVTRCLEDAPGVVVAASDYMKVLPDMISKWVPKRMISLGTDGFGRSDSRAALRDHFEVDRRWIAVAALVGLAREGAIEADVARQAMDDLDINPDKLDPHTA